jgi:glycogen synthase
MNTRSNKKIENSEHKYINSKTKSKIPTKSKVQNPPNLATSIETDLKIASSKEVSELQKRKKVLMLGWEFPPVINGGLGVACLGISKGLSRFVDLTVILPKSDPAFIVQNVELIGLNNLDLRELLKKENYEARKRIQEQEVHPESGFSENKTPENGEKMINTYIDPVTEYDTFADTEYVNIQIDPYYHPFKDITDQDSYLQNFTRTSKNAEEGTSNENEKINNEELQNRRVSSVFAFANRGSREVYDEEGEELQTEDLMIEKFLHAFRDGELYGEDVIQKVILYSKYVLKIAQRKDFDIIYAHDWMTFLAGLEVKAKTGKPLALHVHALDYDRGGPDSKGWIFELEKYAMENADLIMPVSNYTASVITGHYGINSKKVSAVHNGADHVEVVKGQKGFPEKLVLFLGRVTGQKGPEFFLEVASKVFASYPKVRFVVAGTGDRLKRLIETGAFRQIGHKFHFTGFLTKEKVHRLLGMTDVYCMPSVSEPFGLSALEAAQFGVPMVISKQSGVAEVLGGALSADYWDVNLMAEQIIKLLKSKRLSSKVVKQSLIDMEKLTWDIAAAKIYDNFYRY